VKTIVIEKEKSSNRFSIGDILYGTGFRKHDIANTRRSFIRTAVMYAIFQIRSKMTLDKTRGFLISGRTALSGPEQLFQRIRRGGTLQSIDRYYPRGMLRGRAKSLYNRAAKLIRRSKSL
jgi:hypothetical protein